MITKLNCIAYTLENNISHFLKGLSTHHLNSSENAFVNTKGQIVATFQQKSLSPNLFLIVVAQYASEFLEKHLQKYFKLTKTKLKRLDTHYVYIDPHHKHNPAEDEWLISGLWAPLLISKHRHKTSTDGNSFLQWRLKVQMPLHGIDFRNEMLLNVHPSRYVDFKKGCFLGQEVLSRVHHRSRPPRKLVICSYHECPSDLRKKMTSLCKDSDGQTHGFVFLKNKDTNSVPK